MDIRENTVSSEQGLLFFVLFLDMAFIFFVSMSTQTAWSATADDPARQSGVCLRLWPRHYDVSDAQEQDGILDLKLKMPPTQDGPASIGPHLQATCFMHSLRAVLTLRQVVRERLSE